MPGNVPDISQGLGKFTPDLWRRLWRVIQRVEESGLVNDPDKYGPFRRWRERPFIAAQLNVTTDSDGVESVEDPVAISGNAYRWKYSFREVTIIDDFTWEVLDSGLVGSNTADTYALNLLEFGNADQGGIIAPGIALGPNTDPDDPTRGTNYPANFSPRPIESGSTDSTGTVQRPVVLMTYIREKPSGANTEWLPRPVFSVANAHDGTCE